MTPPLTTACRETTCPFCGLAFDRGDALCHHGCPIAELCNLVACPGCGYEFPDQPRQTQPAAAGEARRARPLLDRLFQIGRPRPALDPHTPSVRDLARGARARVLHLAGERSRDALAVFGVVPGAELELLQKSPAFVVRIGETELALEADVAARILVAES